MRTTLTLDDDVAAALDRIRRTRGVALKAIVNEALREWLQLTRVRPTPREPFRTRPVDLGRLRIGSIDNVGDALAVAETEVF
jgi:hypothetical protein